MRRAACISAARSAVNGNVSFPGLDCAVCVWALSRWLVAPIQEDSHIKSGVVCPRSEHAMVEIEPVHLGPHDMPINLLVDGPAAGINSGEAALIRSEFSMLSGHRRRGIIRNAVNEFRPLKRSPFSKEFRQIRKRGFLLL